MLSFCSMGRYFIILFRDFFAAVAKLSDLTFTPLKLWKLSAQWADTVLCYLSAQWAGTLFCYLSAQWADTLLRILPFSAFVTHVKNHLFKEILNISNSISLNSSSLVLETNIIWNTEHFKFNLSELNSSSLVLETNIIWDQYYITLETWFLDYSTASFYIHYSSSYLKKPKTETSCWSMASWTGEKWHGGMSNPRISAAAFRSVVFCSCLCFAVKMLQNVFNVFKISVCCLYHISIFFFTYILGQIIAMTFSARRLYGIDFLK